MKVGVKNPKKAIKILTFFKKTLDKWVNVVI